MAEWVVSDFIFKGKDAGAFLARFSENIDGTTIPFSFNKVIPMPEYVFKGVLDKKTKKIYGKNNWYDWSITHWGSKFNCGNVALFEKDNFYNLSFFTPYYFPKPIILKLTEIIANEYLDVSFIVKYCTENVTAISGSYWYEPVVSGGNGELQFKIDTTLSDRIKRNIEINGNSPCFYQDCDGNYHQHQCGIYCPNYQNCH